MEEEYPIIIAIIGFIGTMIGILGSLIVTFLTNKQQLKKIRVQNEYNFRLEELKIITSMKKEKLSDLLPKLEEAAGLVSKLSFDYSNTYSYMDALKKINPEDYSEWYRKSNRKLDRLTAIIQIHFNELSPQVHELAGLTNIFWGNQHLLLYKTDGDDEKGYMQIKQKVVVASEKIGQVASTMLDCMSTHADRLNESLL